MARPEALGSGPIIMTGLDPSNAPQSTELEISRELEAALPEGYESVDFSTRS
jgi:hypothetical protein